MVTNARRLIAAYFYDYAAWCRQKSLFSGESEQERCTAEQFEALALYVLALPEDDPRLHSLAKFAIYDGMDVVTPGPMLSSVIAKYQYSTQDDFDALLDSLVNAAIADSEKASEFDQEYAPILR